jgi:energy-coupling factor transporter ATP-binding protein EcfA2
MATKKSDKSVQPVEAKPEGLQIIEMRVENIKRIRLAHLKPKGNVVVVAGKNGSGKTSLLDAISWGLTGTSTVPTFPIRKGQRVGKVQIDLGDFIVTRHFTHVDPERSAKGNTYMTKLTVEGKRREQFPNPQTLLNALMGKISFDPLAFTRMDDKEQLKTLRGLVTFDVDVDAVQAEIKAAYDERREAGRIFDQAKGRLAAMTPPEEGLPAKPIDVETITKKLEGASNHNSVVASAKAKKERLLEEAQALVTLNKEHIEEIERLKAKIAELAQKMEDNISSARTKHAESNAMEIAAEIDTAALAAEISAANATNTKIAAAFNYRLTEDEVSDANAEWERLDAIVKGRTQDLEDALARAQMPIEGLGIGDDEVLYNGLPFGQASNAEQIQVSMALAMASNPKLRVLRIADGSLLDDDSFALIAAAAEKHGFQVWIERVDASGKVGIVMEDGEASGDEVVEEEAAKK